VVEGAWNILAGFIPSYGLVEETSTQIDDLVKEYFVGFDDVQMISYLRGLSEANELEVEGR